MVTDGTQFVLFNTSKIPFSEIKSLYRPNLEDPIQAEILGNLLFLLSIDTDDANVRTIQVLDYNSSTLNINHTISCENSQSNVGINGFALAPVSVNGTIVTYVIFFSCIDTYYGVQYQSF